MAVAVAVLDTLTIVSTGATLAAAAVVEVVAFGIELLRVVTVVIALPKFA